MAEQQTRPCRECGKPLPVGPRGGGPKRCLECGVKAGVANALQMREKRGPAYERWRKGMREVARNL